MKQKRNVRIFFAGGLFAVGVFLSGAGYLSADSLNAKCFAVFESSGQCPEEICELNCFYPEGEDECKDVCFARECSDISAEDCPVEFCDIMQSCHGNKVCHPPYVGEKPSCGELAYFGQDVPCCTGYVRRCGVEFLDGTCDMEGQDDPMYGVPICIPCGDGVCGQFEDACNCPEDCGEPGEEYRGRVFNESDFRSRPAGIEQKDKGSENPAAEQKTVIQLPGKTIQKINSPGGQVTIETPNP